MVTYKNLWALIMMAAMPGCATLPSGGTQGESPEVAAFNQSVYQTAVFRKSAVLPLKPLTYPVQAANFTNYTAWAAGKEGQTVVLTRDLWLTVEPELQTLCRAFAPDQVIPRLHKVLGLQPATAADAGRQFVLFTIEKVTANGPTGQGVFRPCADPDPMATACGNTLNGSDAYIKWFASNQLSSYKMDPAMADTGYPWTRLGYTYNWDNASLDHRGAQEYVVPAGTPVQIRAVVSPTEYCRPAP